MKKHFSAIAVVIALTAAVLLQTPNFGRTNSVIPPVCPIEICTPAS